MLKYKTKKFLPAKSFDDMLKVELKASTYENLAATLGVNEVWLSRYKNNPSEMKLGTVMSLAKELNYPPAHLLETYGCGAKGMNAGECLSLQEMSKPQTA